MASTTMGQYPEQLIAMVSSETKDFLKEQAAETKRSLSAVTRDYIDAGIAASKGGPTISGFTLDPAKGDSVTVDIHPVEVEPDPETGDNVEWMEQTPPRPPKTFY